MNYKLEFKRYVHPFNFTNVFRFIVCRAYPTNQPIIVKHWVLKIFNFFKVAYIPTNFNLSVHQTFENFEEKFFFMIFIKIAL